MPTTLKTILKTIIVIKKVVDTKNINRTNKLKYRKTRSCVPGLYTGKGQISWAYILWGKSAIETLEQHCVKYAQIRYFSGPYFPVYRKNRIRIFPCFIYGEEGKYSGFLRYVHLYICVKVTTNTFTT